MVGPNMSHLEELRGQIGPSKKLGTILLSHKELSDYFDPFSLMTIV